MDKESYLINQLAERAGVTVRTIRYYVNEGLLPPPQTKGRYSAYDEDYLYRIRLIKYYKEAYLPLSRIRELLESMTPGQIRETVEMYEKEPPEFNLPSPSEPLILGQENLSAREYLRRIQEPPANYQSSELNRVNLHMALPLMSRTPGDDDDEGELSWKRIEAADGIELLVREDVYRKRRQEIDMLLARLGRGSRQT
jgi:DNA-binding transcriptional MerR regulator